MFILMSKLICFEQWHHLKLKLVLVNLEEIHGTTSHAFSKVPLVQPLTPSSSCPHLPTLSQTFAPTPAPSQVLPSFSHSSTSSTASTSSSPSLSPTGQPTNPNQPTQSTQRLTGSTNVPTSTIQRANGQVSNRQLLILFL